VQVLAERRLRRKVKGAHQTTDAARVHACIDPSICCRFIRSVENQTGPRMSWLTTGQIFRCIDPWPRMGPRSLIDCSSVKLSRRVGRCCYVRARRSYPVWPCDGGKYGYGFPVSHAVCPSVSPTPQTTAAACVSPLPVSICISAHVAVIC